MDKIIKDMRSGYIKILNLASLRNISLEQENLIVTMAKTCKIDKLIIMDEKYKHVKEILQNENIKEVSLYGPDNFNFEILKYIKQRNVNDNSKRIYRSSTFLQLLQNNPNLRCIKAYFSFNHQENNYYEMMDKLLSNYKIENIVNTSRHSHENIQLVLSRNNNIWNDAKKKCLNFIAIRKFRCNYENINQLEGNAIYLAQLPKEIILQISKHVFTLVHQDITDRKKKVTDTLEEENEISNILNNIFPNFK